MGKIFAFDQNDLLQQQGAFMTTTLNPELANYGQGVCLGLSQLWMTLTTSGELNSTQFILEVKKPLNQQEIANWMKAQDTILQLIKYDYKYKKTVSIANVNTPEGRMNTKKAFDERRTNLTQWGTKNSLTFKDDIYRFGHVIPFSKQNDLDNYRKSFCDSMAQDILTIIKKADIGLLAFTGEDSGHACAFLKKSFTSVYIFDPNYGVDELANKSEISDLLYNNVVNGLDLDEHWWIVGFKK